jgi:anti-sigma factor RsiW
MAYFDGEVDALSGADIERHLETCAACRKRYQEFSDLHVALQQGIPDVHAPEYLRSRVLRALDEATPAEPRKRELRFMRYRGRQGFWLGAVGGLACGIAACLVAVQLLKPAASTSIVNELVSAHIGSLMSSHLTDVISTDQHTVKPWFAGRTEVSPVTVDLESQGYKLIGGRVDYIDHQPAAVVVYQHGPHVINVFAWSADSAISQSKLSRNGYHMSFWKAGDLEYCAVSDTSWGELSTLVDLLKGLAQ